MEGFKPSYTVNIDLNSPRGRIKPMHAVNRAPVVPVDRGAVNLFDKLREARVPFARLHDVGGPFGGGRYVDIANVFPDFDADETDPASYDFAFTDVLLNEFHKRGIEPFYRFGSTIENNHRIKAYNIYPPADFHKWARICEHIVRHYNEGWADGFQMGIRYLEIWNEPDNEPEIADNPMWKGTKEQFFELYDVASKHLKTCFPELRVGGYGSCGFYALSDADFSETAHSSTRTGYFIEFFLDFLAYAREHGCVLDFFSWHSYADVHANVASAAYVKKKLSEYGYGTCEVFLNEWNPGIALRGTVRDAANILDMMCRMQNTETDMCMYYDAQMISAYCGIFDPVKHDVFPAYYAFYLFGKLYALGSQAASEVCAAGAADPNAETAVTALAAADDAACGVVLVNRTASEQRVVLTFTDVMRQKPDPAAEVYAVDKEHACVPVAETPDALLLPPYGIRYVSFSLS